MCYLKQPVLHGVKVARSYVTFPIPTAVEDGQEVSSALRAREQLTDKGQGGIYVSGGGGGIGSFPGTPRTRTADSQGPGGEIYVSGV